MTSPDRSIVAVEWLHGKFRFIDQTKLPHEEVYVETADYKIVGEAIRRLGIRGAPAIGVAAAYALVLAVSKVEIKTTDDLGSEFYTAFNYLAQTRPTAVNLFTALNRMRQKFEEVSNASTLTSRANLFAEAWKIQQEDIEACRQMGEYGATLFDGTVSVLTHCNAGALATAGEGTALSVIVHAARQGKITRVYADETRPLLQGARLTSWELVKAGIETILITDSTAGYLMQKRQVNAVVVGADRIAANGDVANKIGTYALAVLAERHSIPFYVVAPLTTIDHTTPTGREIPIEERGAEEVTHMAGKRIAAEGVDVFAPAFDVTPHELISAIVTDRGILRPPYDDAIHQLRP